MNHIILLFAVLMSLGPAIAQEPPYKVPTLVVQGQGSVDKAPDQAEIAIAVETDGKSPAEAVEANTLAMTKIIADMARFIADKSDVQTQSLSLSPIYGDVSGPNNQPRIVSYKAMNGVRVKVRDLTKLGDMLQIVVSAGANRLNGLTFQHKDVEKLQDEARRLAVLDAKRKAEIMVSAAGIRLGDVLSIRESGGFVPRPYAADMMLHSARAAAPVPVEAGTLAVSNGVEIVWMIRP
jgi:uncharacterized protein